MTRRRKYIFLVIGSTVLVTGLVLLLLQNFRSAEKVMERRIDHRYAISDPQFRREMSALLGPAIISGNQVTALQNGDEIFPAMLQAVRSAQTSITFETYIYWSGEVGEELSEALSERARAGVPVNVIIDWVGSTKMEQSLLDKMEAAGVLLHRYRPLHWYNLGSMNNRTHRKLLVVDGRIGFTGGVGIADQWQGNAGDPEHWRDTHYRIEGPVVAQFQAAFNDNWIKTTGKVLNGPDYFPPLQEEGDLDAHVFIASPSGGSESMHLMYLLASDWGVLLQAGAEFHLYQPTMLHTKLLVIDTEFVSVGSTNFDMRSIRLNDEASLNIYNRDFAAQMTAVFEDDLLSAESYSLSHWQSRPLREKLSEKILLPIKSQL